MCGDVGEFTDCFDEIGKEKSKVREQGEEDEGIDRM